VFSNNVNDLNGSSDKNSFNNSIEIYNPTDNFIDLSDYTVKLISPSDSPVHIRLSGFLLSDE